MLSKEFLIEYERKYSSHDAYNYPAATFMRSDHFCQRLTNRGPEFQKMTIQDAKLLLDRIAPRLPEFNKLVELGQPYWVVCKDLGFSILLKNGMPQKGKWISYLETIMGPNRNGELVEPRNYRDLPIIYQD